MERKTNYSDSLYKDYENLQKKFEQQQLELKHTSLCQKKAEDEQRRLERVIEKKENIIEDLSYKNNGLIKENEFLKKEIERLKMLENNDGTTCGLPTSKTPIGKKKVVPNFAKNTGGKIERKQGHKKDKLNKLADNKINEKLEHILKFCPRC